MSLLDEIKSKAAELINIAEPTATRQTNNYNSSKNIIRVAGVTLDGVVSGTVNNDTLVNQEVGIDYYYTTFTTAITPRTLTVEVLPTARCLTVLRALLLKQQQTRGWFNIQVFENDDIVNVYRGLILEFVEVTMQKEADNRRIVFAIKPMFQTVLPIDTPTKTEQATYSEFGARPDLTRSVPESVYVNEQTSSGGGLVTYPYNPRQEEVDYSQANDDLSD